MNQSGYEFKGHRSFEPQKTEKELRFATIQIDEADFELIYEAMMQLKKRCRQNAISCLKGYGSASSSQKSEDWKIKADDIDNLISRIATEMN